MKNYVFIDIETNGFPTVDGNEKIIKISAIKLDKSFKKLDNFTSYVKDKVKLTPTLEKLTNVTNEELEKYGVDEKSSIEKLLTYIEDSILISYNARFDMSFILKAIYNNDIKDHEIYYFDLIQDLKELGIKQKALEKVKEYYKIKEKNNLISIVLIMKKILKEYKFSNLEEYCTKNKENKIRFPGLSSKNTRIWVKFSNGKQKDNRRIIEFIDESKDKKVSYLTNYNGINRKLTTLDELIEFRKMGAKTIDNIFYLNPTFMSYIDYYKINSNIKIEKEDTWLIERLNKVVTEHLKNMKVEIICYGSIEELKKNYSIIDDKILNKIISFIVVEI